jgi:hypothetical protein
MVELLIYLVMFIYLGYLFYQCEKSVIDMHEKQSEILKRVHYYEQALKENNH